GRVRTRVALASAAKNSALARLAQYRLAGKSCGGGKTIQPTARKFVCSGHAARAERERSASAICPQAVLSLTSDLGPLTSFPHAVPLRLKQGNRHAVRQIQTSHFRANWNP